MPTPKQPELNKKVEEETRMLVDLISGLNLNWLRKMDKQRVGYEDFVLPKEERYIKRFLDSIAQELSIAENRGRKKEREEIRGWAEKFRKK